LSPPISEMKIIILTQILCVCITLSKTIYKPTNSTNPAQLLSTPAKAIHTRRNRETSHIQANPVGGSSHPPRPEWWELEEIWPPRERLYEGHNITADDIYRAINVYENDFDEWPICDAGADTNEISTETTNCAAFNVVIESASTQVPSKPWWWPDEEIWPPRARVYEELNITEDDIYRAIKVYGEGFDKWPMCRRGMSCLLTAYDIYRETEVYGRSKWPICRGISCETINCSTISCAAFNLVFDIAPHDKPYYWPDEEIWPPRARVYKGLNITAYDIYIALNHIQYIKGSMCTGSDAETTCAARNLAKEIEAVGLSTWRYEDCDSATNGFGGYLPAAITPSPRTCGACRIRKAGGKCVWSRSNCRYRGRSRRRPNKRPSSGFFPAYTPAYRPAPRIRFNPYKDRYTG